MRLVDEAEGEALGQGLEIETVKRVANLRAIARGGMLVTVADLSPSPPIYKEGSWEYQLLHFYLESVRDCTGGGATEMQMLERMLGESSFEESGKGSTSTKDGDRQSTHTDTLELLNVMWEGCLQGGQRVLEAMSKSIGPDYTGVFQGDFEADRLTEKQYAVNAAESAQSKIARGDIITRLDGEESLSFVEIVMIQGNSLRAEDEVPQFEYTVLVPLSSSDLETAHRASQSTNELTGLLSVLSIQPSKDDGTKDSIMTGT